MKIIKKILLLMAVILIVSLVWRFINSASGIGVLFQLGWIYFFLSPILVTVGMLLIMAKRTADWTIAFISAAGIVFVAGIILTSLFPIK